MMNHEKRPAARSGEHPAVKAYRSKLDSVGEKGDAAVSALDRDLEEFLKDLQSRPPPPPPAEPV